MKITVFGEDMMPSLQKLGICNYIKWSPELIFLYESMQKMQPLPWSIFNFGQKSCFLGPPKVETQ